VFNNGYYWMRKFFQCTQKKSKPNGVIKYVRDLFNFLTFVCVLLEFMYFGYYADDKEFIYY